VYSILIYSCLLIGPVSSVHAELHTHAMDFCYKQALFKNFPMRITSSQNDHISTIEIRNATAERNIFLMPTIEFFNIPLT
jgi:predicted alpha/beta hydrolase family esterase